MPAAKRSLPEIIVCPETEAIAVITQKLTIMIVRNCIHPSRRWWLFKRYCKRSRVSFHLSGNFFIISGKAENDCLRKGQLKYQTIGEVVKPSGRGIGDGDTYQYPKGASAGISPNFR
ncbi:MAG: hypothetical protein JW913_14270 [Chitinispirillaceae bacterium]|nr:hypothetical protein [Chitinispirillaceae bacterium]